MSGYVAMSRDWQEHDLFGGDEFSRRDAWAWLIAQAAWKPTTARVKGSKIDLQRGELCFSQRFLAAKWGWSKSRVDRFLSLLRDEGMIETRTKNGATAGQSADHPAGQGQSIISICNYDRYQPDKEAKRGNIEPPSGAGTETRAGQQRGKEEKGNNTIPNGMGGEPPDPAKLMFDAGVDLLGRSGVPEKQARSLIGKWRSQAGDDEVRLAIGEATVARVSDPVPWLTKRLANCRKRPSSEPGSFLEYRIEQRRREQARAISTG